MPNNFDRALAAAIRYDVINESDEKEGMGWTSLRTIVHHPEYSAPLDKFYPYLFMAIRLNKVKAFMFLLEMGINPNITDENGDTLIIWATRLNNIELMKVLLTKKVEPNFQNKIGKDAFDYIDSQEAFDLLTEHDVSKQKFAQLAYRLHEKAMIIGLDDDAKTLRSMSAKLGNENAIRIESYGTFFQNSEASSSSGTLPSSAPQPSTNTQ